MSTNIATQTPSLVYNAIASGTPANLIDVRTPAEFTDGHATGARSIPLDVVNAEQVKASLGEQAGTDQPVYLLCASGRRATRAAEQLAEQGLQNLVVVEGGTQAWQRDQLPIERTSTLPSLERQTQIALGILMLLFLINGALLHPAFFAAIAFMAAGLIYAGVSAKCGLTGLLAMMPWNQGAACRIA